MERYKGFHTGRAIFFMMAVITCMLCGAVLKIAASMVVPFLISLFLALVLHPLLTIPKQFRIPRILSVFAATAFIVGGLFFIGVAVFISGKNLVSLYLEPEYQKKLTNIYQILAKFFELTFDEDLSFLENLLSQLEIKTRIFMITLSFSNNFFLFARNALMVVFFMVFLLFEASFFSNKLETAFEEKMADQIKKIGSDIMSQISRYLSIKFIISVGNGLVVGGLLHLTGLEFALVWGILQFILNFIPALGSIAIGFIVSVFALVQFWPDPQPIILVVIIMLGVNIILGTILEPKIMGDNLGLSPFVVILSLIVWGFLWGFIGMILAVPMTVIIKIICENVTVLEPVSIILGSRKAVLKKKQEYETEKPETGNSVATQSQELKF
ncbi:MAG: AI-2E family transporter [Treponema sp.]|jgi:predicted PurR-regulated permease PerM|nr:AI-2E family transporter [Treponema sp.]